MHADTIVSVSKTTKPSWARMTSLPRSGRSPPAASGRFLPVDVGLRLIILVVADRSSDACAAVKAGGRALAFGWEGGRLGQGYADRAENQSTS